MIDVKLLAVLEYKMGSSDEVEGVKSGSDLPIFWQVSGDIQTGDIGLYEIYLS